MHRIYGPWRARVRNVLKGGTHIKQYEENRKITLSQIQKRIKSVHGDAIFIVPSTYTDTQGKSTFVHKEKGVWDAWVYNILNGATHPQIQIDNRTISLSEIKERLLKVHGGLVTIVENTYKNTHEKATFIHKYDGSWESLPMNVIKGTLHTKHKTKLLTHLQVKEKIEKIHGNNISIVWETYVDYHSKALFTHLVYGNFCSTLCQILKGHGPLAGVQDKMIENSLRKYGVKHPSQNIEVALKMAKSSNFTTILKHWKTHQDLICKASYELKVVDYLNTNKLDFLWQHEVFVTPILTPKGNLSTYRPDLFLIAENKWIEIKGYFRKDALDKWNWFKTQFPDAELWDERKLKELGIL